MKIEPKKGMRFYHSRVLSNEPFDGKTKQVYEITRIASGNVFYHAVYGYGTTNERLGKGAQFCREEQWPRWCEAVILPQLTES